MRFSTISAVLCGLAIVPGVVSQRDEGSDNPEEPGAAAGGPLTTTTPPSTTENSSITSVRGSDLSGTQVSVNSPLPAAGESKAPNKVPQIAGGVVGGVLALVLIGGLIFFLKRRQRNREKPSAHHESAVIADKSRASSPVSHTSPIYGGAGAAVVPPPAAPTRQFTDPEFANPLPPQQPVVPIAPVYTPQQQQAAYSPGSPAELQSREVDGDGVSVNSFDMQRPVDEPTVPRLPVCQLKGSGL